MPSGPCCFASRRRPSTNVVRHARATRVAISVIRTPDGIRMDIADNGISFAVEKVVSAKNPRRIGLLGMKERLEMVGGSLIIESVRGRGTTVRADIPFPPKAVPGRWRSLARPAVAAQRSAKVGT